MVNSRRSKPCLAVPSILRPQSLKSQWTRFRALDTVADLLTVSVIAHLADVHVVDPESLLDPNWLAWKFQEASGRFCARS